MEAENGEIIGTPTQPSGEWLMWNQSYEDFEFSSRFTCNGVCNARVLLGATKKTAAWTS